MSITNESVVRIIDRIRPSDLRERQALKTFHVFNGGRKALPRTFGRYLRQIPLVPDSVLCAPWPFELVVLVDPRTPRLCRLQSLGIKPGIVAHCEDVEDPHREPYWLACHDGELTKGVAYSQCRDLEIGRVGRAANLDDGIALLAQYPSVIYANHLDCPGTRLGDNPSFLASIVRWDDGLRVIPNREDQAMATHGSVWKYAGPRN